MLRTVYLLALSLCFLSVDAIAQWEQIATLPTQIRVIKMLDQSVGFIGTGNVPGGYQGGPVGIFKTTDGGNSWRQTNTPGSYRGVLDIFMTTSTHGWAAAYIDGGGSILWKTTDAGENWEEIDGVGSQCGTGVVETANAVLVCDFYGRIFRSTDKGQSWDLVKQHSDALLHLAFLDDMNGMIAAYRDRGAWCVTSDGGATWVESQKDDESWSLYADKETKTYYAFPEGHSNLSFWKSSVWKSTDMGHNWEVTASMPFRSTGHIDGSNGALYIQTNELGCAGCGDENVYKRGIYKSVNEGKDWEYIGGPKGWPDCRFEVLPVSCGGNIVYVANDREVWKFVDGSATNGIEINAKEQAPIKGIDQEINLPLAVSFDQSAEVEKLHVRKVTFTLRFDTSIVFIDRDRAREIYQPPTGWILQNMTKHADGMSITIVDTGAVGIVSEQSLGSIMIVPKSPKERNTTVVLTKIVLLDGENGLSNACLEIKSDYITNVFVEQGTSDVRDFATPKTAITLVPNPARNITTLTLKLREASVVDFGIYSVEGEEKFRQRADGHIYSTGVYQFQLPISTLPAGQYFVRVTADNRILVEGMTIY